jgi:deoxyribonuclease-4
MGAQGVITHIGSHGGRGFEAVSDQIAAGLSEILETVPEGTDLILENAAGAGGIVGARIEELAELVTRTDGHPRLRVALDTAHLTGSGWDFKEEESAGRLADAVSSSLGLERLSVIHANDSAVPVASRRDRHANIGDGHIGLEGFRNLLAEPRLRGVPWVMETPDLGDRVPGEPTGSLLRLRELSEQVPARPHVNV